MIQLKVKLLHEDGKVPTYGSEFSAGMDLYSSEDKVIPAHSTILVSTGISVSWSGDDAQHYYLRIAPRSGLAFKNGLFVNAGVVDYDYRGEVKVVMYNSKENDFEVKKGDRIAQCILEKIIRPQILQVEELDITERGEGGFGSTGKH